MKLPGLFCSDDMSIRPEFNSNSTIDELVNEQELNDQYDRFYFPNINSEDVLKENEKKFVIVGLCLENSELEIKKSVKKFLKTYSKIYPNITFLYYIFYHIF